MIKNAIRYGWGKTKENLEISIFTTLLMLIVGVVSGGGKGFFKSILGILATIFLLVIRIGYNKIFLRISDGEKPKFSDIFNEYRLFWKFLGVSILMPIVVLAGLILLIVPGIIWAVRFSLSPLILVDTHMGPIASMKESFAITRGNFWNLLGFWIIIGLINLLGLLIIGVGLLITIPVSTFAMIHIYRSLSSSRASVAAKPSPMPAPVA